MITFLAEAYLHQLDPIILPIAGDFALRWYGLSYAVGFVIAWLLLRWMAKTGRAALTATDVSDLMFAVILGVLLGGRLGYALFYDPSLFVGFSRSLPWWDLFAINKGGMASHGGMIGVIIAIWIFARRRQRSALHLIDLGAIAAPAGLGLGRIANFINGELWGRPLPESMQADPPWWSIKYPEEITEVWAPVLAEPDRYSPEIVAQITARFESIEPALRGALSPSADFLQRIVATARNAEAVAHEQVIEIIRPALTAYYPSQIFQAIADGPVLLAILALLWLRPRKPGVIGGSFLITYGVLRIITELFRQPDEGVALTFGLLSRGQTLSALMIVVGIGMFAICARRPVEPMGGLLHPSSPPDQAT